MNAPGRRPPALNGARVAGYAAMVALQYAGPKLAEAVSSLRAAGRDEDAAETEAALLELRTAVWLWEAFRAGGSDSGTAEPATAPGPQSSKNVLLDVTAVAKRLGVSDSFVRRLLRDGSLAGLRRAGRWLVDEDEVLIYETRSRKAS